MIWVYLISLLFTPTSHEVTVGEFSQFVEATGYETTAEKYGWSAVAITNSKFKKVYGAHWRKPNGIDSAKDEMPVTQVSWYDAKAYCEWKGVGLYTLNEWENKANWQNIGNTLDTGNGTLVPAKQTAMLGNVWEWVQEGYCVGGSYLCSMETCAGFTKEEFIHKPGKDAGCNNIGFRTK